MHRFHIHEIVPKFEQILVKFHKNENLKLGLMVRFFEAIVVEFYEIFRKITKKVEKLVTDHSKMIRIL